MSTGPETHRRSTPFGTIARRIVRGSLTLLLFLAFAVGARYLWVTAALKACFATKNGAYSATYNSATWTTSSVEFTIPKSLDLKLPGVREVGVALGTVEAISLASSTASEIAASASLPGLKRLSMSLPKCLASEVDWARLGGHRLEEISLDGTGLSDEDLLALVRQHRIRKLQLFDERTLSLAGVRRVAELNELFELRIHGTPAKSTEWRALFEAVPKLAVLSVSGPTLDDAAIEPLRNRTELAFIQLLETQLSLKGLESLPPPQSLRYLLIDGLKAGGGTASTLLKYNLLSQLELHRAELTQDEKAELTAGLGLNANGTGCQVLITTSEEIAQHDREIQLEEARAAALAR